MNGGGRSGPGGGGWGLVVHHVGGDDLAEFVRRAGEDGWEVTVTTTPARVRSAIANLRPAVVVVDDRVDGWLRLVGGLTRSRSHPKFVLISDLVDRLELVNALHAGIDGIVRHGDEPAAQLRAVRAVSVDGVSLPRSMLADLVAEVRSGRSRRVPTENGRVAVTDREWQILQLMVHGFTTREMADELFVAVGTVRSHVSSLLGKLGVATRDEAIELMTNG